jgi:toxic protein SymE
MQYLKIVKKFASKYAKEPTDVAWGATHSGRVHARDESGSSCGELYTRMERNYLPLSGDWLSAPGLRMAGR